ncbi:MAG: translation initiation factor IF-2 [Lachnospiraceae bacterium]|nr:translation initiation factor IF-2 [Lachnospiraceae bacterium]
MARKITVHNLAKEVGVSNRDIIDYLTGKGYESMTAVSAVPDGEVLNIRARFGQAPEAPAEDAPKADAPKPEAETAAAADEVKDAEKPKKKGMVRVFRSQNASRQLQKRPRRPAAPAKEPEKTVKPLVDGNKGGEKPVSAAPLTEAPATGAETPVPEIAPKPAEAAAKAAPDLTAPEKETAASPAKETKDAPAAEVKKETPEVSASAAPAPAKAAPGAQPEAKKSEAAKSAAPAQTAKTGGETKAPAASAAAPEKKAEDTGFRNGRIIRSFGSAIRNQTAAGSRGTRDSRGGARTGGPSRDRNAGRGPAGDRGRAPQGGDRGRGGFAGRPGDRTRDGRSGGPAGARPAPGAGPARGGAFAGRGRTPAPAASGGDSAMSRKPGRDRKDSKERERNREERRENGRGRGAEQNRRGSTFNRIPKALQGKHNAPQEKKQEEAVTEIRIPERITVRDLADRMKIPGAQIVKELFLKGEMVTLNHELPYEKAEEIAMEHDIICEMEEKEDVIGALLAEEEEDESIMTSRPPVVCVMGHVDHGKTSLLDAIRNTHVTDREAGGITQHIGAYMVSVKGQKITFLDTPGHEAFTAMRMRGANATDIAVLVVAADDGVMPQTVEAINHAKAAGTEIIVAVNKIDKPGANIDRVKQELSEYELVAEDWGGSTVFCPVSAKTQEGLENLLEMILLTSEMHELKANAKRKARGIVLEAKLDKGRGPVASILIQKGTLHQGDFIACGAAHGKVRAMTDENGRRLQKATPSMPVEIIGLSSVPEAGEVLVSLDSDKEAKDFAAVFVSENKKNLIEETKTQISLDDLFNQIREGNLKELPIVVKADVQGSVEAVSQSLLKLSNEEVVVKVIHGGVGAINESDVSLAAASNAIIIGFNVRPDATAKQVAENQKVEIKLYNVIYEAIEDVERALKGMRAAVYEEKIQGHAEIRQMFRASSVGNIAGAYIRDGIFTKSSKVRVFRKDEKIYEGTLASLKRFKDDVKEVREGFECGFVFDGWGDFEVEDTVEAYTMVEVPRE